jgi:hypothetical protein
MAPTFDHIVLQSESGQSVHAPINGDVGLLMFLRGAGDAGFSSRNPDFTGSPSDLVEFRLDNGQVDHYPSAWVLPRTTIDRALAHFGTFGTAPDFVVWHNDSGDW